MSMASEWARCGPPRCTDTSTSYITRLIPRHLISRNFLFDYTHPGGNLGADLKSFSHRCYLREVAFAWELTKEIIYLPLGCLQVG